MHMREHLEEALEDIVAGGLRNTFGDSVAAADLARHTCDVGRVLKEMQQKLESLIVEYGIWEGTVATSVLPP